MEISEKEYTESINELSRIVFTTAISKGVDNYEQNIRDMIDGSVDVLDVLFPNINNYSAMILSVELFEIKGIALTINREVMHTNELFEFKDIEYEK